MAFDNITGNRSLIDNLQKTIQSGNVHHAYIFEGPLTADKKGIAVSFAQALLCPEIPGRGCGVCAVCRRIENGNHLDVISVQATVEEGRKVKSVKDNHIDKLIERLMSKPYEGDRNIAIVEDAGTITPRAANRLLKNLEEPAIGTVIMLLTENIADLSQTIRSRCVHMRVLAGENSVSEYGRVSEELVSMFARREKYYNIKPLIESIGKMSYQAFAFLDSLEDEYRKRLLDRSSGMKKDTVFYAVKVIEETRRKIKMHVVTQFALKEMALKLCG